MQGKDDPWRWVGINKILNVENTKNKLGIMNCNDCGHFFKSLFEIWLFNKK